MQIMQYGLMSKLSAGYALLDALLVMLVPLLVNRLLPQLQTLVRQLFTRAAPAELNHERIIIHKQNPSRNWWYSAEDDEHPNHKLQQAIIVYLNMLPELFSQLESCNVQLCKAKRKPTATASDSGSSGDAGSGDGSSATSSDNDWYPGVYTCTVAITSCLALAWCYLHPGCAMLCPAAVLDITRSKSCTQRVLTTVQYVITCR
jgi:hypothetical protein